MNGSLFLRREEVVHLSGKCLEGNSQSKRRSNAQKNKNKPPQVKLQICSYTCRYTRTYNILKNSAVTKTLCNCMFDYVVLFTVLKLLHKNTHREHFVGQCVSCTVNQPQLLYGHVFYEFLIIDRNPLCNDNSLLQQKYLRCLLFVLL